MKCGAVAAGYCGVVHACKGGNVFSEPSRFTLLPSSSTSHEAGRR